MQTSKSRFGAQSRVSSELVLLQILYATAVVALYPVLKTWWDTRSETVRSIMYAVVGTQLMGRRALEFRLFENKR